MLFNDLRSINSIDQVIDVLEANKLWVACHLVLLSLLTLWALTSRSSSIPAPRPSRKSRTKMTPSDPVKLDPPKDSVFTPQELSQFDGSDASKPIYVAIKGIVFDVSNKREVYGPGGSYHVFAGKDGSKGLGQSSLKVEDAIADYSSLSEAELKVLDDWVAFFKKRYNILGKVVQK